METLKVTLSQKYTNKQGVELGTQLAINIKDVDTSANDSVLIGTILDEIIEFISWQKDIKNKRLKLNQAIQLKIEAKGLQAIDFGTLDIDTIETIKIGQKAKAKREFCRRVVSTINYIIRERKAKTLAELFARLDAQIKLEEQSK